MVHRFEALYVADTSEVAEHEEISEQDIQDILDEPARSEPPEEGSGPHTEIALEELPPDLVDDAYNEEVTRSEQDEEELIANIEFIDSSNRLQTSQEDDVDASRESSQNHTESTESEDTIDELEEVESTEDEAQSPHDTEIQEKEIQEDEELAELESVEAESATPVIATQSVQAEGGESSDDEEPLIFRRVNRARMRSIMQYIDQILDDLPRGRIKEFANSQYFDIYQELFKELDIEIE